METEQKPVASVTEQLPNHRRQILEPKSITLSDNKVILLAFVNTSVNSIVFKCNSRIWCVGWVQGRIKASVGPGAVPNAGPLQTYNQLTTPTNCGPKKLRARVLQHP